MPQHPRYSNSPEKNYEDLGNMLWELEKFAYIHGEIDQPINQLMSNLYPEITKTYVLHSNNLPLDAKIENYDPEEIEDYLPNVFEIWQLINDDQEEQFIQDYKHVIGACVFGEGWQRCNDMKLIDELIKLRNPEYYQMHIRVECDPQTLDVYKDDERTAWFSSKWDIFPTRIGIYEISNSDYEELPKVSGYAYWNGKNWHESCVMLADCIEQKRNKKTSRKYGYTWRGFINFISSEQLLERKHNYKNRRKQTLNRLRSSREFDIAQPI